MVSTERAFEPTIKDAAIYEQSHLHVLETRLWRDQAPGVTACSMTHQSHPWEVDTRAIG
jgi:hypothetical protein